MLNNKTIKDDIEIIILWTISSTICFSSALNNLEKQDYKGSLIWFIICLICIFITRYFYKKIL